MDLATRAKLVEVAPGLREDNVSRHRLREGVEKHHQFVDVHVAIDGFLTIHGHDGDADEQVKGRGLVVGPAGLPDGQSVFFGELPLQADQEPAVTEHQREPALRLLQIGVKRGDEHLDQHPQWLLHVQENSECSLYCSTTCIRSNK